MLGIILLAAALTGTAPTPAPSPTPALKVIANVRSIPRCAAIVTHANSAISSALDNDMVITQTITRLRLVDLDDGNPVHRRNGLQALGDLAKTLVQQARSADNEVKRLRQLAKTSSDPAEGKDLEAFADQLGGALWRQQTIGRDLNGYLATVDFHDMAKFDEGQRALNQAAFGVSDPLAETPVEVRNNTTSRPQNPNVINPPMPEHLGHEHGYPTATEQAHAAADDFQRRIPPISVDESAAASRIDGALRGC